MTTVWMTRPRGRGGVAMVAERLARALGDPVRLIPVGRRGPERWGGRALIRDLWRVGARPDAGDLVHVHTSLRRRSLARDAVLLAAVRARSCRTVLHVHGWDRRLVERGPAWMRRAVRSADVVLVVDPQTVPALAAWDVAARVLDNPSDGASGGPRDPDPETILFLGRISEEKGLFELVDAFGRLLRRRPAARLRIAGAGPALGAMQQRVLERGVARRVSFLGWVGRSTAAAELARAGALVLPSWEEAAPLAVIEALARGVPVVATRTGRVPELVGDAGVVVPVKDVAALVEGLDAVLSDPGRGVRGPARVERFHPAVVASQLRDVYAGLAP